MKVVINSNIFITCLNSFSPYHKVFQSLIKGQYNMAVSTEIAFEYREVFSVKFNKEKSILFFGIVETLKNVIEVKVFFSWNLIYSDPDDNKFVDCAVAANADYLVTNDKHFNILKDINFPKVQCITIEKFLEILQKPE